MSNYTTNAVIARQILGAAIKPSIAVVTDQVSSGISSVQMRAGIAIAGVSDAVSSASDTMVSAVSTAGEYLQSGADAVVTTVSTKSAAAISGASDYIASVSLPELAPSHYYTIAAVAAAVSAAAVAYQVTKPVATVTFASDIDSEDSCSNDSDCQSELSEVTYEDTDTVVAADPSSVSGYVDYLVTQLNHAMVVISNYLADFAVAFDNIMTNISEDLSSVWSGMTSLVVSQDGQKSVNAVALEDRTSNVDVVTVCGDSDCGCDHSHTPSV